MKIIKGGVNKQLEIIRSLSLHNKPLNRQKKVKKEEEKERSSFLRAKRGSSITT
jgi:hypothetical protein